MIILNEMIASSEAREKVLDETLNLDAKAFFMFLSLQCFSTLL